MGVGGVVGEGSKGKEGRWRFVGYVVDCCCI